MEWVKETKWNESTLNESKWHESEAKETERRNHSIDWSINQSINQIMACKTRDKRGHCVWSLHRGLPRRPGPRSHRINWRNNQWINESINQSINQSISSNITYKNEWMNEWMYWLHEWMNELMGEQLKMNDAKWNEVMNESKWMNEKKVLGKPSVKAAKTERWRASEPMPGIAKIGCRLKCEGRETCKWVDSAKVSLHRRIPLSADMTDNTANERVKWRADNQRKE